MRFNHQVHFYREAWRRFGVLGGVAFVLRHILWNTLALLRFGPTRLHLAQAIASLLNGCWHCGFAHVRAFELAYFRKVGTLFPLDEARLVELSRGPDEELRRQWESAFQAARMPVERELLEAIWTLKVEGAAPRSFTDQCLLRCIELMDLVNYSCIADPRPLEDLSPGGRALKRAYARARMAELGRD